MEEIKKISKILSPYIIVILITINVHDFIIETSNDTTFVNNFNFASTITSIILSVVAIVYTLIDGAQSKGIQTKIIDSADDIQKSVKELKEVSLRMKDIDNKINKLEENIIKSNSELATTLSYREDFDKQEIDNSKPISEELENIMANLSYENMRNCFLFYKAFKEEVTLNLNDFNEFFNQILKDDDLPNINIVEGALLTLDMMSSLGYIEYSVFNKNKVKIHDFDKKLEDTIMKYVPEENNYADAPELRMFGTVYKYFDIIKNTKI